MGGFLIQAGATVLCSHGGQAMAIAPNPRVTIDGQPTALIFTAWVVAGVHWCLLRCRRVCQPNG